MRTEDLILMVELGILNARADEFSSFMVWGLLIKDPVIWKRKIALAHAAGSTVIPIGAVNEIVVALTVDEKEELRDRILAQCENRKPGN